MEWDWGNIVEVWVFNDYGRVVVGINDELKWFVVLFVEIVVKFLLFDLFFVCFGCVVVKIDVESCGFDCL